MKTLKKLVALLVFCSVVIACKNEQPEVKTVQVDTETAKASIDPNAKIAMAEFTIEGMTCAMGCAKTIEKKLAKMEGVKSATVDFDKKLAMVSYDEAKVTTESLEETVKKTGETYSVKDMKTVDESPAKKACADDCNKDCCKDKTEAEIKACQAACKKACCAGKAK